MKYIFDSATFKLISTVGSELWVVGDNNTKTLEFHFTDTENIDNFECRAVIKRADGETTNEIICTPVHSGSENYYKLVIGNWITEISGSVDITVRRKKYNTVTGEYDIISYGVIKKDVGEGVNPDAVKTILDEQYLGLLTGIADIQPNLIHKITDLDSAVLDGVYQFDSGLLIVNSNKQVKITSGQLERRQLVEGVWSEWESVDIFEINNLIENGIINGTLETFIKDKLTEKELEVAPRLTNVENEIANIKNIKADITYVDTITQNIASGSPKGVYATLTDLQTAYPTGTEGIYIVEADGGWWYWNGIMWVQGGQYQSTGIADKSISLEKINFAKQNQQNLFNPYTTTDGFRLSTIGEPTPDASYTLSDYITVENGKTYRAYIGTTGIWRICGYDSNKNFIKIVSTGLLNSPIIIDFDGFIKVAVLLENKYQTQVVDLSIYNGSFTAWQVEFEDFVKANPKINSVGETELKNNSVSIEKVSFVEQGKNLFNKDNVTVGYYVNVTNGDLEALAGYNATDYILVKSGVTYTITKARHIVLLNTSKGYISGINNSTREDQIITPNQDGYIRYSVEDIYINISQMEIGNKKTDYEAFGYKINNLLINDASISIKSLNNFLLNKIISNNKKIIVYKYENVCNIRSKFNETQDIVIYTKLDASSNGTFIIIQTTLIDANSDIQFINEQIIHSNSDDITPVRTFTTVGANHGYTNLIQVNLAGHDKTSADLGSKWTDGVTTYTLLKIKDANLYFGCPYTIDDGIVNSVIINPVANLFHVSGATNTANISIAALISSPQLYPSVNKKSVRLILDGFELIEDGTFIGETLEIKENYNIMDYKSIIDYAQSHIGTSYANDEVEGVLNLSINYIFKKGGKCNISHTFKVLKKVRISNCGFIQSFPMSYVDHKVLRYLPNVKEKNGFDFKGLIDLTTYNQSLVFIASDLVNPSLPPNRQVDWLINSTTSTKKIGFTMGYFPDKTNSKNLDRLNNTTKYWDLRSTTKSYPIAMSDLVFNVGDYKTFMAYRNYLTPNEATNINIVEDSKDTYIFIDYHQNIIGKNILLDEHIGKTITIIDSLNFALLNDVVDTDGITFSITDTYGYAVLKIN